MIDVYPDKLTYFTHNRVNDKFCLIITEAIINKVVLHESKLYKERIMLVCHENENIYEVIGRVECQDSDILFIPAQYFGFPSPDTVKSTQRFITLACSTSTGTGLEDIPTVLETCYNHTPEQLQHKANILFDKIEGAYSLDFINEEFKTKATLEINEKCLWHEICGMIKQGGDTIAPIGEVAITHCDFDNLITPALDISGEIVLHGIPIVNSFFQGDQYFFKRDEIFQRLSSLEKSPVIANVKNGKIIEMKAVNPKKTDLINYFETLFDMDKQFRTIIELGIGINDAIEILPFNAAYNESFSNGNYCIHYGIGKRETTKYHIDVICPGTKLKPDNGNAFSLNLPPKIQRKTKGSCPCTDESPP